jgi:hypothetical protein
MTEPSRNLDEPNREPAPRTPRWVVLFGVIVAAAIATFLIHLFTPGHGGGHGPGRHHSHLSHDQGGPRLQTGAEQAPGTARSEDDRR